MREVSCLVATRFDQVLLESKDRGVHWHFPQQDIRIDKNGAPIETPLDAIYRIVENFDDLNEEDVVIEGSRLFRSHRGIETEYHIFTTGSKLMNNELKASESLYEWTNDPHSKNINECTRRKLMEYGFYPL